MTTWNTLVGKAFWEISVQQTTDEEIEVQVDALASLLALPRESRLLDVPCGYGKYSGSLAKRGFNVVAIDLSHELLQLAQERSPGPSYLLGDMRDPPLGVFDGILNLGTSFGYFPTRKENAALLKRWASAIREGGILIIETTDLERAETLFKRENEAVSLHEFEESSTLVRGLWDWRSCTTTHFYRTNRGVVEVHMKLYSREQIIEMLEEAGFNHIECYGGFDKSPKLASSRLIIRAER